MSTIKEARGEAQHHTHVERAVTGSYYVWCSHSDCYWRSRRFRAESDAEEAARRHPIKVGAA